MGECNISLEWWRRHEWQFGHDWAGSVFAWTGDPICYSGFSSRPLGRVLGASFVSVSLHPAAIAIYRYRRAHSLR